MVIIFPVCQWGSMYVPMFPLYITVLHCTVLYLPRERGDAGDSRLQEHDGLGDQLRRGCHRFPVLLVAHTMCARPRTPRATPGMVYYYTSYTCLIDVIFSSNTEIIFLLKGTLGILDGYNLRPYLLDLVAKG